ncbi:MAG: ribonuclease J [Rhodospirillales bacterium]|nr:ribonuclease J [Rhodospirillales bacterium]
MTRDDELLFLPLGGAGEIGMNLNLYGFGPPGRHRWLMVDLGVTFSDGAAPVDVIMPDPAFIEERRDKLVGLVLTHAHEDHLGAVPYLWERLRCPIYATPFTAEVLGHKLREAGLADVPVRRVALGSRFRIEPFDIELITLTHSIPEPNAVAIRTPLGTVLHTGDWKFDPDPVVGPTADEAALRRLGDEGVLAIVCDSTNVFMEGTSGSEAALRESLQGIVAGCAGRVAVTCFASNVARLETIAAAAAANGRDVVAAGRSLRRIEQAARATGYMRDVAPFIDEAEAGFFPRDRVLILCTGSQGEPRAALSRIATGEHPNVRLEKGDAVIFSSRVIPGNETAIARLQNDLVRLGVRFVTWNDAPVHVSGHPARDELTHMYQLARPRIAIPVHGELRHLVAHAELARGCQVAEAVVAENGALVRLGPGRAEIVERVHAGRLGVDGGRVVPLDGEMLRSRVRAFYNGVAVVTVVVDADGRVGETELSAVGLLDDRDKGTRDAAIEAARAAVDDAPPRVRADDNQLREAVRVAVRRVFRNRLAKKPVTHVHLVRGGGDEG